MNKWVAYLNGEFIPEDETKISIFDRGWLYGDGCFETLRVFKRKVCELGEHIDRLFKSLNALKFHTFQMTKEEVEKAVLETCRRNKVKDAFLRINVSRGISKYPLLDVRVAETPTIAIFLREVEPPPKMKRTYRSEKGVGLRVITSRMRKIPSISIDARIKSLNYLNSVLAIQEALEMNKDDAIMVSIDGYVTEMTGSNILMVKNNNIYTPPPANMLIGITRQIIIELAKVDGYKAEEKRLTPYDFHTADEVFVTSSGSGLRPVIEIDNVIIGTGEPGPITLKLQGLFVNYREKTGTPYE